MKFKNILSNSIPVFFTIIGLICVLLGNFIEFANIKYNATFSLIGSSVLASGVFAFLLKFTQFAGVYKEELNNIIYDTKFIENRLDIVDFWEKVTRSLFKNKFPKISDKLMYDIKEMYLPTSHVSYYEDVEHKIEISLEDNDFIKVKQTNIITVHPVAKSKFEYNFKNILLYCDKNDGTYFRILSFKVDDKNTDIKLNQTPFEDKLQSSFQVSLSGKEKYKIEQIVEKKYCLKYDNVIGFIANNIVHNLRLQIFHDEKIKLAFYKNGTILNYKSNSVSRKGYFEKNYLGLIYVHQGYYTVITKE